MNRHSTYSAERSPRRYEPHTTTLSTRGVSDARRLGEDVEVDRNVYRGVSTGDPKFEQEGLLSAFFAIDTNHDETITTDELRSHMIRNNYDESFVHKWLAIFDKNNTGVITLQEYCDAFGLVPKTVSEHRSRWHQSHHHRTSSPTSSSLHTTAHHRTDRTSSDYHEHSASRREETHRGGGSMMLHEGEAEIISEDMAADMQTRVIEYARDAMRRYASSEKEMARAIKQTLDEQYGRIWHVTIVKGQYWIHYSHEPGYEIHFKIRNFLFLIWRTPAC